MAQEDVFKKIVSHCKEYGFVFPSSEIYDGLGAVYDYGQLGVELKNNIKQYWWQSMTLLHENIVGIDSAIFMHPTIWKASGHVDAFNDPLIDKVQCSPYKCRLDFLTMLIFLLRLLHFSSLYNKGWYKGEEWKMRRKCEGFSVDVTLLVLSMLQNNFMVRSYPKAMVRNYTVKSENR